MHKDATYSHPYFSHLTNQRELTSIFIPSCPELLWWHSLPLCILPLVYSSSTRKESRHLKSGNYICYLMDCFYFFLDEAVVSVSFSNLFLKFLIRMLYYTKNMFFWYKYKMHCIKTYLYFHVHFEGKYFPHIMFITTIIATLQY